MKFTRYFKIENTAYKSKGAAEYILYKRYNKDSRIKVYSIGNDWFLGVEKKKLICGVPSVLGKIKFLIG